MLTKRGLRQRLRQFYDICRTVTFKSNSEELLIFVWFLKRNNFRDYGRSLRDHPFRTHATFPDKLTFSTHVCVSEGKEC